MGILGAEGAGCVGQAPLCGEVPHPIPPHLRGEGTCCAMGRGCVSAESDLPPPRPRGGLGWGG
ncbi:MAG: hypothetical protein C0456_17195 [Hyphomonas sp.]|nr:hypothetical protein [Hyphomonas sp.]